MYGTILVIMVEKSEFWQINRDIQHIEYKARYKLAMLQSVLDEDDYAEALKLLENAANEGNEFAGAMVACHYEEGAYLRKKMQEEGELHLQKAMEAEDADDHSTASSEYFKSLLSFTPAIEADKFRELARKIKEKYKNRDLRKRLNLTRREQEIFTLLLSGTAPKEIAYKLKISYPTVNFHSNNLYRKLGIQSRAELFAKYGG